MDAFTYEALGGRVTFGAGAAGARLSGELEAVGGRRVLLIATVRGRAVAEVLFESLTDRRAGSFFKVKPHVPVEVAHEARELARRVRADSLLCIGGGSTIGTAKAVALETALPIVAVPTTYSGSEMTPIWGMTEAGRKTTGIAPQVRPRSVIYDPELPRSLPRPVAGASALNAVAHGIEALYAQKANPVTSLMAEEGLGVLFEGLVHLGEHPRATVPESLLYGAYLAAAAFAVTRSGLHHKMCHVLGGSYDLPHAPTHAVLLPHVLAYNAPAMPDALTRIRRALKRSDPAASLHELLTVLGIPQSLEAIGMRRDDLKDAVKRCVEVAPADNPRRVGEDHVQIILERAFSGSPPTSVSLVS